MRRTGRPALVVLAAAAAFAAWSAGCERIEQYEPDSGNPEEDGGAPDGGDGGGGGDAGAVDAGTDAGGPVDAGPTGAWLVSFSPSGQYLRAPADGGLTSPVVLSLSILRAQGELGPVRVDITSTDASVASVQGNVLTIPPGQTAVQVPLNSSAPGIAWLTTTFDGGTIQVRVNVLPTILISEVAAASGGTAMDEYVELYNPTPLDFLLNNFVLQYHSMNAGGQYLTVCTLGPLEHIGPFGYYLIGVNAYSRGEDFHSTWTGFSFSANSGTVRFGAAGLTIMPNDPLVLDKVAWEDTPGDAVDPEGGAAVDISSALFSFGSIERKARSTSTTLTMGSLGGDHTSGNAYDTNNNATDWVTKGGTQEPQTSTSGQEFPP